LGRKFEIEADNLKSLAKARLVHDAEKRAIPDKVHGKAGSRSLSDLGNQHRKTSGV